MPDWINGPMVLGTIAGIFAIASAVWSSVDQSRHDAETNALNAKLLAKSDEVIRLQSDQLGFFRGTGSVFYLHFVSTRSGTPEAHIMVQGTNPVPKVHFAIYDWDAVGAAKDKPMEEKKHLFKERDLTNVWPNSELTISFDFATDAAKANYGILYTVPDGRLTQIVAMRKLDDRTITFAYRVFRFVSPAKLKAGLREVKELRFVDERYPRLQDGRAEFIDETEKLGLPGPVEK